MTERRLLEALRRVLVPPVAPPEGSVEQLRRVVVAAAAPRPVHGRWGTWRRRIALPIVAFGAVLGMTGVAFALNTATPLAAVVRNVAHDVGLPVESGRLLDTRDAIVRLRTALSSGDTTVARREARGLQKRLADLHPDEQRQLPEASGLLQQALPADSSSSDTVAAPGHDQLILASTHPSMPAGSTSQFSVHRLGATGADVGVVAAVLSIAPDGSCQDLTCTATVAGPHTVTATAGALLGTIALPVVAGPPDHTSIAPRPAVVAGSGVSFGVEAFDAFGNDVGDATASTALAIAPDGACTGITCSATVAGPHTVTVATGLPATPATVNVVAGLVDHLVFPVPDKPLVAGTAATLAVTPVDAFGNAVNDPSSRPSLVMADGTCTDTRCSSTSVGPHAVDARYGSLTATQVVQVVPGPVAQLVVPPGDHSQLAGEAVTMAVDGFDRFGNGLGDLSGSATFSIFPEGTCDGPVCSATAAGLHTVDATIGAATVATEVVVFPGPLAQLRVTPASATVSAGHAVGFSVDGFDRYGNSLGDTTSSTVFAVAPDGSCHAASCSATTAGEHSVSATAGDLTVTVPLDVVAGPASDLRLSPGQANAAVGGPVSYRAEAFDRYGNDVGDATFSATFEISPDGSCDGNRCWGDVVGSHTVTARWNEAAGSAQLDVSDP